MRALILAGGSGTRFWPLSRRQRPKQLLALDGERSLLQSTFDRLQSLIAPQDVWVCTTELLADAVRAQLPDVPAAQVLCEPEGRNTAPAIGWSLRCMGIDESTQLEDGEDDVVAVLPADHRVADTAAFRRVLGAAAGVARSTGRVLALGVTPRWAETGYGYLELGDRLADDPQALEVRCFREKPDAATAQQYLGGGRHLWNAGIFVFRGGPLLGHLRAFEPEIAQGLDTIAAHPESTAELFPSLPSISIDYAVMERLDDIATVPLDAGWSDLGSWQALDDVLTAQSNDESANADNNNTHGDVLAIDSTGNLLWADEGKIAVVGIENLVVVRTGDSVLVVPKDRSQDVKKIVDALRAGGRDDLL